MEYAVNFHLEARFLNKSGIKFDYSIIYHVSMQLIV